MKPAIFVASTYDKTSPLYGALFESEGINDTVTSAGWSCRIYSKPGIETVTAEFGKSIEYLFQVFHFAGHAEGQRLQFNDRAPTIEELAEAEQTGTTYWLGAEGLAQILASPKSVKLVFLNGCSTNEQADIFRQAGIPAVIFTNLPLRDSLGQKFAEEFYKSFFQGKTTLQAAFDVAEGAIKALQGNLPDNGFDPQLHAALNRGISAFSPADFVGKPLYQLSASDDFKEKKLGDWLGAQPTPTPDAANQKANHVPEATVWLCDRSDQVTDFELVLKNLADGTMPGPVFFFVHEHERASPLGLSRRFELYGLDDFCEMYAQFKRQSFSWKTIRLPKRGHLLHPDVCKVGLFDVWNQVYPCPPDPAKGRRAFVQALPPDTVLLVHHSLNESDVESGKDLKFLMEFYLGDFGNILTSELSAKLAVIFTLEYAEEKNDFKPLFKKLATQHQAKVKNLTALKPVTKQMVLNWKNLVFKDKPNAPQLNELLPDEVPHPMDMATAVKWLLQGIEKYNRGR